MEMSEQKLNSLLQGELSAIETYNMALDKIKTPSTAAVLTECRSCHSDRAAKLTQMVSALGAQPETTSGAWGAFAKLVEGGAAILGEGAAVGALKEGEDQGLETYRSAAKHREETSGEFVALNLLPAQEKTQKAISSLYDTMPSR